MLTHIVLVKKFIPKGGSSASTLLQEEILRLITRKMFYLDCKLRENKCKFIP